MWVSAGSDTFCLHCPNSSCLFLVPSQCGGRSWPGDLLNQFLASAWLLLSAVSFSQRWTVCWNTENFSKLWAIHHRGPRGLCGKSGGSVENQQTSFPTQPPLVATSKQPLLGPTWTFGRLLLPLPALPYLPPCLLGALKARDHILARPVLCCWTRSWWLGSGRTWARKDSLGLQLNSIWVSTLSGGRLVPPWWVENAGGFRASYALLQGGWTKVIFGSHLSKVGPACEKTVRDHVLTSFVYGLD